MKHVPPMALMLNVSSMIVRSPMKKKSIRLVEVSSLLLVCSKVVQQRYGLPSSTIHRSIPNPIPPSPVRMLSNSQSVPPSSYTSGSINLTQTAPASILSSPTTNFSSTQIFQTPTMNGLSKDRTQQQQQGQSDKRNRSVKESTAGKLSTLNETQFSSGQEIAEQITPTSTPTQKRKESKRKSNIFTVSVPVMIYSSIRDTFV